jgi:hypothetical protein
MYHLTKEENEALWKALRNSNKLISKGRLVSEKKKDEDHDLQDESNTAKEIKDR